MDVNTSIISSESLKLWEPIADPLPSIERNLFFKILSYVSRGDLFETLHVNHSWRVLSLEFGYTYSQFLKEQFFEFGKKMGCSAIAGLSQQFQEDREIPCSLKKIAELEPLLREKACLFLYRSLEKRFKHDKCF